MKLVTLAMLVVCSTTSSRVELLLITPARTISPRRIKHLQFYGRAFFYPLSKDMFSCLCLLNYRIGHEYPMQFYNFYPSVKQNTFLY
ncbi:hypothetical protein BDF14DRAFT_1779528 [Spinellus fusiger]|nr:hypothetical protein BDF14DRAFT_1779528 [Spinellus fusiger]